MKPSQSNRREFLKTTAGVTAASLVTPYIFTTSKAKAAESPNDRLNVAAIGVGGRGAGIGHEASQFGNMIAVADVDQTAAEKFANEHGKCKIYNDYRKILERDDIDVIICGTPDHWHTKVSLDTLSSGKHIYCEKPLTLTLGESKIITAAAKNSNKVFQVGTQQRSEFNQAFLKAVAIAQSGRLGKKLHALTSIGPADRGGPFPIQAPPKTLDWDFWLGQSPKVDFCPNRVGWNFRWWLEYSGGQVTDWGVHHGDIALWALGGDKTGILEAEGSGDFPLFNSGEVDVVKFLNGKVKLPPTYNVANTFDCNWKLPNGNTVLLTSGENELIISGSEGKIRVNRGPDGHGALTGKPVEVIAASKSDTQWLDDQVAKLYRNMPMEGHMSNFFHCIKTGEIPISDVETHCNTVNACHISNIAMLLKKKLQWDQKEYKFVGDAANEANQFINRVQREPYAIKS